MIHSLDTGNKPLLDDPEDIVVSEEDRARIESMNGQVSLALFCYCYVYYIELLCIMH